MNPALILAKFGVRADAIDIARLLEDCQPLLNRFRRRGFLEDRKIEETYLMRNRFFMEQDKPKADPSDMKATNRQRCLLLTMPNLL